MADSKLPIPSNPLPAGVPETPQAPTALPFALPVDTNAEQARAKLDELKTDADWQKRFFAGDKRTLSEFDELTRRVVGAGADKPAEPENLARPPAPPSASFYQFPSRVLDTPEATAQAAEARTVAFEHGITASEFTSIAEQQQNDASRFAGMTDEQKAATIDAELARIFGEHHDRVLENIERYLREYPALKQKINDLGLVYNKRAAMVLGDLANSKYGLRR